LAVDQAFQNKRLGELLLIDALMRAKRIYTEAGGIGLFVDAIDEPAAGYYRRFGLETSPDNPLLLFLPVTSIGM
jgi:ribosomal protein S18 acetylase RimI-like enzyme